MASKKKKSPAKGQPAPSAQKGKKASAAKKTVTTRAKSGGTAKAKTEKASRRKGVGTAKTTAAKKKGDAKRTVRKETAAQLKAKKVAATGKKVRQIAKTPVRKKEKTGAAAQAAPSATRFHELRRMLITKREGILQEAKQEIAKYVSGENRQLVDTAIDEGDWATVDISEDISLRRLGAQRQILKDIEECLRKIQEGTYGICEECGEEISAKRLGVIPTATLCIDCKENREKMAAAERAAEL